MRMVRNAQFNAPICLLSANATRKSDFMLMAFDLLRGVYTVEKIPLPYLAPSLSLSKSFFFAFSDSGRF